MTRIYALDADDAVSFHVFMQRLGSAPVARLRRVVFDDEAVHERLARFYVLRIHSDVADLQDRSWRRAGLRRTDR